MTKDEALKMAIEALGFEGVRDTEEYWQMMEAAINACKAALEQPAQEPVGEVKIIKDGHKVISWDCHWYKEFTESTPLYTHPAQPLSDDEICKVLGITGNEEPRYIRERIADARAIEQAHGIGVKDE